MDFDELERIVGDERAIIYVRDMAGRYVHVNDRYAEDLPFSRDEVLGKTNRELYGQSATMNWEVADSLSVASDSFLVIPEDYYDPTTRKWRKFLSLKMPIVRGVSRFIAGVSIELLDDNALEYERQLAHLRARLIERMGSGG